MPMFLAAAAEKGHNEKERFGILELNYQ